MGDKSTNKKFFGIVIELLKNIPIAPKPTRPRRSPFDVPGLSKSISRQEILEAISESRERS